MFWVGLLIALLAGLTGIGLSREGVKMRFPRIGDYHLDRIAIVLLVIGLAISAFDHFLSERKIESLEKSSNICMNSLSMEFTCIDSVPWTPGIMITESQVFEHRFFV